MKRRALGILFAIINGLVITGICVGLYTSQSDALHSVWESGQLLLAITATAILVGSIALMASIGIAAAFWHLKIDD